MVFVTQSVDNLGRKGKEMLVNISIFVQGLQKDFP